MPDQSLAPALVLARLPARTTQPGGRPLEPTLDDVGVAIAEQLRDQAPLPTDGALPQSREGRDCLAQLLVEIQLLEAVGRERQEPVSERGNRLGVTLQRAAARLIFVAEGLIGIVVDQCNRPPDYFRQAPLASEV